MELLNKIDMMISEVSNNQWWLLVKPDGTVLHEINKRLNQYDWIYSPYDTPNSKVVARKTANGVMKQLRSSKDVKVVDAITREKYLKLHKGPYIGQSGYEF